MRALYAAFERSSARPTARSGLNPDAGVEIEAFVLKASLPQPTTTDATVGEARNRRRGPTPTGYRDALFAERPGWVQTPVYEMERLAPGDSFPGRR